MKVRYRIVRIECGKDHKFSFYADDNFGSRADIINYVSPQRNKLYCSCDDLFIEVASVLTDNNSSDKLREALDEMVAKDLNIKKKENMDNLLSEDDVEADEDESDEEEDEEEDAKWRPDF